MSVIRTQISVAKCADCPFFERTPINFLVEMLAKTGMRSGTCRYNGLGQQFPIGRLHVPNEAAIPDGCPLKGGDCTITLERRT